MRYVAGLMVLLMLLAAPVFAADADNVKALRKELRQVSKQIKVAMRKAAKDENVRGLKKQMRKTKKAYEAVLKTASQDTPEIQEIDKKIAELKKQRKELINKSEGVAVPKTAYDDALGAYNKAVNEAAGVDLAELQKKRGELQTKMKTRREERKKARGAKKGKKKAAEQPDEDGE